MDLDSLVDSQKPFDRGRLPVVATKGQPRGCAQLGVIEARVIAQHSARQRRPDEQTPDQLSPPGAHRVCSACAAFARLAAPRGLVMRNSDQACSSARRSAMNSARL